MARDAGNSLHWEDPSSPHKKAPARRCWKKRSPPSKSSAGRGNTHAWSLLLHLCEVGAGRRAGYPSEHAPTSHTLCALLKGAHPPIRVTRTHFTRIVSFPRTHTHRPSCCLEQRHRPLGCNAKISKLVSNVPWSPHDSGVAVVDRRLVEGGGSQPQPICA